jgi:hypothetical protein
LVYVVVYLALGALLIADFLKLIPGEEDSSSKAWESPVDLFLWGVGLAGVLLFMGKVDILWVKSCWKPISVLLLAAQVSLNIWGRLRHFREVTRVDRDGVFFADIFTIISLLPALLLNIGYAFR